MNTNNTNEPWSWIEGAVLFEDNHLIAVNKPAGVNVQGDASGDMPLVEMVRHYIRVKYNKPGNVFCGLIHRLDRPVSGVILLAKTSKALERMNKQFATAHPDKRYWAIVDKAPKEKSGRLINHLQKNEKQNKSYIVEAPTKFSKEARLNYELIATGDHYSLLEVRLETGRHHQIRSQLAHMGCIIKGDLKYGAKRSNSDGSISLHARKLIFKHPTQGELITVEAPVPDDTLWCWFEERAK